MRRLVLVACVACSTPPLTIQLEVQSGAGRTCPRGTDLDPKCEDVPLACESMVLVRVLDPTQPLSPFISSCVQVRQGAGKNLCSIVTLPLDPTSLPASGELPNRTLEVQVVVLPLQQGSDGNLDCDSSVQNLRFTSVTGVPESDSLSPPIGGHAYYHPGDSVTVVELGCNDLDVLNLPVCTGTTNTHINASVTELDSLTGVGSDVARNLALSVGEPVAVGSAYELTADHTQPLTPLAGPPPSWAADLDTQFTSAACLDVRDAGDLTTDTLTCARVQSATQKNFDFTGVHVTKERLAGIVAAIHTQDPTFAVDGHGLVLGITLDQGLPVAGIHVAGAGATVRYLSADGQTLGADQTTSTGIWVSTDAPFLTAWAAPIHTATASGFGGLIEDKVTVVVLQASQTQTP